MLGVARDASPHVSPRQTGRGAFNIPLAPTSLAQANIVRTADNRSNSLALDPPPPIQTKGTIAGKDEIDRWENLVGPFLVHSLLGPRTPSPPF